MMIRETVLTTLDGSGAPHIAPLGVHEADGGIVLAPFHPSATLENLRATGEAVINLTDDVLIIAGCLTGRRSWPCVPARHVQPPRLANTLAHREVRVERIDEDDLRPRFHCRIIHEESHAPFQGFNRAQAAIIEAAILVSRLHLLPADQVRAEFAALARPVAKTAGPREQQAWQWLAERIETRLADGPA